ncbi:cysteine hydrolase family protein [Ideonella sp.]|uniref:cysteine hydrolase family protein n=1 Tax=Ideonella sp. TaxID=1929293 RepID=UPI0035B13BF5
MTTASPLSATLAALVVIDVQQALCVGEYAAHDIDRVIARLNGLMHQARAARVPVVLVQHEEDDGPLVHGAPGWQLADGLEARAEDLRVRKRTPNSFHETGLDALLRARGVRHLVVGGLQTEFCVDTTVRQALALGYGVTLVADGHSTCDGAITAEQAVAHHNRTLGFLGGFAAGIQVAPAAELSFAASAA